MSSCHESSVLLAGGAGFAESESCLGFGAKDKRKNDERETQEALVSLGRAGAAQV